MLWIQWHQILIFLHAGTLNKFPCQFDLAESLLQTNGDVCPMNENTLAVKKKKFPQKEIMDFLKAAFLPSNMPH